MDDVVEELLRIVVESLQYEEGNLNEAVDLAINFSTKNSIFFDQLLSLSTYCGSEGSYELAYVFAKTTANLSTGSEKAVAHHNAGTASYFLNLPMEAEEHYKLALQADPKHVNTHSNYGLLLSDMGRRDEAEQQYKLALKLDPKHVNTHYNYGILLYDMRRLDEAGEQYKLALESEPKHVKTHYNYGNLLSDMGSLDEAEEQYKLALESEPNDADIHYNYGLLLYNMESLDEAEEQYKLALESEPNDASTHSNYGILLSDMGRRDEAEEQYKLALESDPKHVNTHYNYGNLLSDMGRLDEAEEQYKLALESDPKHVKTHYNYGNLLSDMGRLDEAEEQYKLALESDPNDASIHSNYGILLSDMGRHEEAEEQYKLALETDPNDADIHYNYGNLLKRMGRLDEVEKQYILALEADPKHVNTHYNYGKLLEQMGRLDEAEKQYKIAIGIDPKMPNSHGAYGLLLFFQDLEEEAIKETEVASRLCRENGDKVKEHLSLAWLYEKFANKYYNLKDYKKSGEYAEISGDEYIEAGKQAGESFKDTSLTKGYTLKGRAKIRKLEIKTPFYKDIIKRIWNKESYEIEKFTKIINCIKDASICYEKAAKASPKDNQLCNACSISMSCLSEMLDYMFAVIKQKKTPELEDKLKNWNEKLSIAKGAYQEHSKGELFIESLYKLMGCIQNLDKYKKYGTREYGRAFEECRKELTEIANNIEGPIQKIIENVTKKMDVCRLKQLPYAGTETGYIPQPNKLSQFLKWILDPKRIGIGVFGIIITVIVNHYNEYLFSLIKRTVTMLLSKI
ncbi:lipoprotein NlpI [Methanosarcina barkeri str. Wiesmoor]|uniref:Lipoprotein NlpI n=2 Tax=Methanosarcina barkeri TaxID=2208 RepID=A0A0E3QN14_METBA|nr:tetratricopeptide repeat protein [Methanosarcina barkeri]AKB51455.1 lipoprotein NlpI [Methanosarcina barkeri str. Wiesmoor]